jgi:hypothetical protein
MKMSAAFSALGIVLILSVAALGIIAVEPDTESSDAAERELYVGSGGTY